jgi:Cobalt transport protein.
MVFTHPVMLGISLLCASAWASALSGRKAVRFGLFALLPLMALTAVLNPLFNHEGATILRWLPNGNPLTLEAIEYGIAAAAMLAAVVAWFACLNHVFTTDKFVYLFGRIIPAMSLLMSMTLRFVPRFAAQARLVSEARKCVHRDVSDGGVLQKARNGLSILSILVTWALESSLDTADSMRSRGYGLPGRTAYSIYRFDRRDAEALAFILVCAAYVIMGGAAGGLYWQYYPVAVGAWSSPYTVSLFAAYLALCAMPIILDVRENQKWKSLRSAI